MPPPPPLVLRGDVFPIHICIYSCREKIFFSIRRELYSILYIVTYRYLVYGYDAKRVVILPDVYGLPGPGGGPRLVYFFTFSIVVIVAVLYVILLLLFDADTLYSACEIKRQSRSAAVARECCETRHAYLSNVRINSDRIRWKRALVHSPEYVKKQDAILKHKAISCKNRSCTNRGRARKNFFFDGRTRVQNLSTHNFLYVSLWFMWSYPFVATYIYVGGVKTCSWTVYF